jgi:hypothetical protein
MAADLFSMLDVGWNLCVPGCSACPAALVPAKIRMGSRNSGFNPGGAGTGSLFPPLFLPFYCVDPVANYA